MPTHTGEEEKHLIDVVRQGRLMDQGRYVDQCEQWFATRTNCPKVLFTSSCTHALEMAAILAGISPGDEVILPSYTFVSTATAFALRGARLVFVDIRPDTMNLDVDQVERALTRNTRAIVAVHYAGIACAMDKIMALANERGIFVIEDAAQAMLASYNDRPLGTIGHLGTFSFHETKNFTSGGAGGLLLVNDEALAARADIVRDKGTNRGQYFRGQVAKYTWHDLGSSYKPTELQAAYLWPQLLAADAIQDARMALWKNYESRLAPLVSSSTLSINAVPEECSHNAHIFYLKVRDLAQRTALINHLKTHDVQATFHFVPLHSSPAGQRYGKFFGKDVWTTRESERLLRLPLWHGMNGEHVSRVTEAV